MQNHQITSRHVSEFSACPRKAWMGCHGGESGHVVDMGSQFSMVESSKVRRAAAASFGLHETKIPFNGWDAACIGTLEAIDAKAALITGAVVELHGAFIRIDCLKKSTDDGYEVVVFSSKTRVSDGCIEKAKSQVAALLSTGTKLAGISFLHLNNKDVKDSVFTQVNFPAFERESLEDAEAVIKAAVSCLNGAVPDGVHGGHCSNNGVCEFESSCNRVVEKGEVDDVSLLPSKSGPIKKELESGIKKIGDLPLKSLKHKRNALMYHSLKLDKAVVTAAARQKVGDLAYPWFFVDFESCAFALPRFEGTKPHQPVVFQWSCHKKEQKGGELSHAEFISLDGSDPRRSFAESLLAELGEVGTVVVFSSFEKQRLAELANIYPDLKEKIEAVMLRLFDACPLVRGGYYSPSMRAKWGLKSIAPTLPACADLEAYDDMDEVANGLAAQGAYGMCVDGIIKGEALEFLKGKMLSYCKTDTRGLAHLLDCIGFSDELVCLEI